MEAPRPQAVEYDPFSPEVLSDPFPTYDELRERCPVHHFSDFGDRGFYTLSRYHDVAALSRETDDWSADYGQGPIYHREGGLRSDPPEHTIYRRLVTAAFTPRRVAALEDDIRQVATELVDGFSANGATDLCASFSGPLPMTVISKILGVPLEKRDEFKEWSNEFMASGSSGDATIQAQKQAKARAQIYAYFNDELDRRRRVTELTPPSSEPSASPVDLLDSLLLATHERRGFTNEQLLPLLLLLLVGGNETTTSLISNLVHRLLEFGLWERVASDESLWDIAVEESLRFDPPVLGLFRTAKGPQEVRGVKIEPNAKVHGLYAAANRDPRVWDNPGVFSLERGLAELRRHHLSFGLGIWLCPGANLARLEGRISLEVLGQRLPGLIESAPPERPNTFMQWSIIHQPVAWVNLAVTERPR
jgi:cytochrome P450